MVDSMMTELETVWKQRNSNRDRARLTAKQVLASPIDEPRIVAVAKGILAYLGYREHNYTQALTLAMEALDALEKKPFDPWLPWIYNTLAMIHFDLGERAACRSYLDLQIQVSQKLGDRACEAAGYHDIGMLQAEIDPRRGLQSIHQAREMFQGLQDAEHEIVALYNLCDIYHDLGEYEQAVQSAHQAYQILQSGDLQERKQYLTVYLLLQMIKMSIVFADYSAVNRLLDDAHLLAHNAAPELLVDVHITHGQYLASIHHDADAIRHFLHALDQLQSSGNYDLATQCHSALTDCYERLGDYRAALGHQRAYSEIRERTFIESSEQKVRALEIIHQIESERKAAELERQRNAELQHYIQELEQMQATLQAISQRDSLTGLYNRRYLTEEGEKLMQYAQRHDYPLCAAMIDVDYFKQVNDQLGHPIGDQVLQQIAELMTNMIRSSDLIARYGGEEIALLLPSTTLHGAYALCERLRMGIEEYDWQQIHPKLRVTVSIGLAQDAQGSLMGLLADADVYLYAAKRSGRNRTSYALSNFNIVVG